ncbi:unnamed protein product [Urochloa humidicola]
MPACLRPSAGCSPDPEAPSLLIRSRLERPSLQAASTPSSKWIPPSAIAGAASRPKPPTSLRAPVALEKAFVAGMHLKTIVDGNSREQCQT